MIHEFVADLEVTSVRIYKQVKHKGGYRNKLDQTASKAFVCAWGVAPIKAATDEEVTLGRTVADFVEEVHTIAKTCSKRDSINVFTHNLKYDGAFILYHVLSTKSAEVVNEVRDNSLYSFDLCFEDGTRATFRDSAKIFPTSVEKLGILYGINKLKGEWDYRKYRDENTPISKEEWQYLIHDILIVCKALRDYRSKGFFQNTIASIAYMNRLHITYPAFEKTKINRLKKFDYERFRQCFPFDIIPLERSVHIACISAYFGGWCYLNPAYAEIDLENIHSFDVNSMYPDKMRNVLLPVGKPSLYKRPTKEQLEEIKLTYPLCIYHISRLTVKLKSDSAVPFLMFPTFPKTSVRCQGKVIKCENESVYMTNIDYAIMKKEYNIESADIDYCIAFKGKKGQYKAFVDYWMKEKAEATFEMNRLIAEDKTETEEYLTQAQRRDTSKKIMNSSYGKDGTKLYRIAKTTRLEEGLLTEDSEVEETTIEYYIPSAVFICAWARKTLYDMIKIAGKGFVYSDTDSVKATEEGYKAILQAAKEGKIQIDDSALGAWKHEAVYEKARFVRQKTYATFENGKWEYTVCGATSEVKKIMKIDEFYSGMVITLEQLHDAGLEGKLIPISVTGGVILEEVPFQISAVEDWGEIGSKNLPILKFKEYMEGREE